MIELENIKLQTTWNDAAQSINSNFAKIIVELAKGGQGGSMPSEYLSDAEAVNHILTITKSDGTTVHFTDTTYDLSPYALSSDLSGYLPLTGGDLIGNLTINSQQVIHSGNISSQSVASAVKLTDNTSYTAWGQTFFENGKPKNVNGDITLDNNKKVYVKDTGGDVVGGLWMDTNNYVRIGQGGYNTYIQGYNILLNSQYGEVVSIRHNGNVGIKNSSPAYDLDVTGTIHASNDIIANGAISAQSSNPLADDLGGGTMDESQLWYILSNGVSGAEYVAIDNLEYKSMTLLGKVVNLGGTLSVEDAKSALGLGSNAYTSTEYIPLTGGTVSSADFAAALEIKRTTPDSGVIKYSNSDGVLGYIGIIPGSVPTFWNASMSQFTLYHTGNLTKATLGLGNVDNTADINKNVFQSELTKRLINFGYGSNTGLTFYQTCASFAGSTASSWASYIIANHGNGETYYSQVLRLPFDSTENVAIQQRVNGTLQGWKKLAFLTDNVASATNAGNADTLDGYHATMGNQKPWGTIPVITYSGYMDIGKHLEFHYDNTTGTDYSTALMCTGNYGNIVNLPAYSGTLALQTDNVASATKLQTARTLWGQSFDGTADVTGGLTGVTSINSLINIANGNVLIGTTADGGYKLQVNDTIYSHSDVYGTERGLIAESSDYKLGFIIGGTGTNRGIYDYTLGKWWIYKTQEDNCLVSIMGNMGVGTTSPVSKLDVAGEVCCNAALQVFDSATRAARLTLASGGSATKFAIYAVSDDGSSLKDLNIGTSGTNGLYYNASTNNWGIGTNAPLYKLDVNGTIHASGDVIAQGAISAQGSNAYADELSEGGLDTSQMWYELGLNDSSKVIHESHIPTLPASKISGLPSELPNPYALTINGQTYDGSAPVTVNVQGGATYSVATTTTDGLLSKNRVTAVERLQTLLSNYWVVREVTAGSVTRTGTDMTIPLSVTRFDMSTTSGSNPSRWVLPIASQSAAGLMSASDKTKLDGMGTDDTDTGGEWYNIHIDKDETSGDSSRILYTVIEDYIPAVKRDENGIPLPDDQRLSILKDNADYRLVLLKWRKRHKRGRGWAMPMFAYERFHTRYDDWENSGSVGVEPEIICDIAENNTWWPVKGVKTRWFAQTNSTYPVALASAMNKTYSANDGKYSLWKNTRNKKLCFGVALYKKTGEGTIGWQRVSNIAYVELFLTKYGTYLTNIRN